MMRRRTWSAVALAVWALYALAPVRALPATQEQPRTVFRSSASAIVVDVSVRHRTGRPMTGLAARDFEVFDNGVLQRVDQVSYGKLPIDITVALDVSHSVSGAMLDRLRQGVVDLMRDLTPQDRLKLLLFNMRISRTVDYTTDVKAVEQAIRAAGAAGGTALLDTLSVALTSASPIDRRQLLVVFTDGSDTISTTTPEALTAVAQRGRATVTLVVPENRATPVVWTVPGGRSTISLSGSIGPPGSPNNLLPILASETGGSVLPVGASANLSSTFRRVLEEFRSAYVLYYTPREVAPGGYHTIDVKVKRANAVVQARRGYFTS